ncbi:hypothetical protein CANARDRAFT_173570 [[Candida] arabinofermentans NRRL YB-2248]|uniref:Uncharacterized protein n=1 Tax=[Candida] arabinofermentans NRRL YB-2248 TaxID=983967 RepID=A0A1E4T7A8_9ASCO|nr:hypothetical protein CANARDRAFT_173570 [[Candida] arabinofermentans NRRL YB-2248]
MTLAMTYKHNSQKLTHTPVFDTYMLASKVKTKLTKEAVRSDVNLHRLVCQANLLDNLIEKLNQESASTMHDTTADSSASMISFESISSSKDGKHVKVLEPTKPNKKSSDNDVGFYYNSDDSDFDSDEDDSDEDDDDNYEYYYEEVSDSEDEDEYEVEDDNYQQTHNQLTKSLGYHQTAHVEVHELNGDSDSDSDSSDLSDQEDELADYESHSGANLSRVSSNSNRIYNLGMSESMVDLNSNYIKTPLELSYESDLDSDEDVDEEEQIVVVDNDADEFHDSYAQDLPSLSACSSISSGDGDDHHAVDVQLTPKEVMEYNLGDTAYYKDLVSHSTTSQLRFTPSLMC